MGAIAGLVYALLDRFFPVKPVLVFARGDEMQVTVRVDIYQPQGGGSINVNESFEVNDCDFIEMAKILGQFHELAKRIKSEREQK